MFERQRMAVRSFEDAANPIALGPILHYHGTRAEQGARMDSNQYPRKDKESPDENANVRLPVAETENSDPAPFPAEEREAPPLDVDDREYADAPSDPIELPARDGSGVEAHSPEMQDQIDELIPLPIDEAYHDDDSIAPDPYDVDDQIDMMMPYPTGDAADEVDDFSTHEELNVDNAPAGRGYDIGAETSDDRFESEQADQASGTTVYVGGPSDDPVENDSDSAKRPDQDELGTDRQFGDQELADANAEADTGAAIPILEEMNETTCPVCGRETDALRFCGYCGANLTNEHRATTASTLTGRMQERALILFEPLGRWTRPGGVRLILALGALLVLIALLANNGAMALIIGSAILPLVLVFWCLHLDVFERESPLIIGGFAIAGTVLGAILGWLGALIVAESWFETGVLNFGAAGFGGQFAERAGSPPFLVWTLVGIVFPLLALAAIIGGPLAMRQTITLHNEVMDGLTLGAVMGAGFSLGTAIVFAAPMLTHGGPIADASAWTLTTIGLTVIRPIVWTLSGGLLLAAAWRYLLTHRIGSALIPAIVGAAVPLIFTLMSLQLSSTGLWPEITWGALMALIVGFFYKRTLGQAIEQDRKILGNDNSRVICPVCHQVTPVGQFCAHCGSDITQDASTE